MREGREGKGREGKGREGKGREGRKGGGWRSERPCSQARHGEDFAAQHNFFLHTFMKFLTPNKHF